MSGKITGALFSGFLACAVFWIYRDKMKFDPPKGLSLVAFRLVYLGAGALFSTVAATIPFLPASSLNEVKGGGLLVLVILLEVGIIAAGFVVFGISKTPSNSERS
jgi:hypothetical protein